MFGDGCIHTSTRRFQIEENTIECGAFSRYDSFSALFSMCTDLDAGESSTCGSKRGDFRYGKRELAQGGAAAQEGFEKGYTESGSPIQLLPFVFQQFIPKAQY